MLYECNIIFYNSLFLAINYVIFKLFFNRNLKKKRKKNFNFNLNFNLSLRKLGLTKNLLYKHNVFQYKKSKRIPAVFKSEMSAFLSDIAWFALIKP